MRPIRFFFRIFLIASLALWLALKPGSAEIVWDGFVIKTSAAFLALGLLFLSFFFFSVFRLVHFLRQGPRFWSLRRKLRRLREGQDKYEQGLLALAAGDGPEAGRLAVASRKLLGVTPATRLLQAQAAKLAGDSKAARGLYKAMAEEEESAVLGYRGLIAEAARAGDLEEAERLMNRLGRIDPDTPWLVLMRFKLAVRRGQWQQAGGFLETLRARKILDPENLRLHQAAVSLALADAAKRSGDFKLALEHSERAFKAAPEWVPASLELAEMLKAGGHLRTAQRILEKAFEKRPHTQIAWLYREATGARNPLEAYKAIDKLTRKKRDDPQSRLALGEAALAAQLWGEARRYLTGLVKDGLATQKVYRLLSALEHQEGQGRKEGEASLWLVKALDAPLDPRWLCSSCGGEASSWSAACPQCGAFHSLLWRIPGVAAPRETGAGLALPPSEDTLGDFS